MPKPKVRQCKHCGRLRYIGARGLCGGCYQSQGIRDLYPASECHVREDDRGNGLTEAEVEGIVAEQSANLPAWFYDDRKRQRVLDGDDSARRVGGALRLRMIPRGFLK